MDQRKTLTKREFAQALGISEALVTKWQKIGKIRVLKLGRCVRVPQEEVDRIILTARIDGMRERGGMQ